jgi:hypothetical protein
VAKRQVESTHRKDHRDKADSSGRVEIWSVGLFACRTECAWGAGIGNFPDTSITSTPSLDSGVDVGHATPSPQCLLECCCRNRNCGLDAVSPCSGGEWRSLSSPAQVLWPRHCGRPLLGCCWQVFFLAPCGSSTFGSSCAGAGVWKAPLRTNPMLRLPSGFPNPSAGTGLVGVLPSRDGFS